MFVLVEQKYGGINDVECMIMMNNGMLHIFFIYIMCYTCLF